MWGSKLAEQFEQDVRFGVRQMRRNPAFASIAAITLALGMGSTIAIFSLTNALLLKPLPVPEPERLVALTHGAEGDRGPSLPYPLFHTVRRSEMGVELFGLSYAKVQLEGRSIEGKSEEAQLVSGNFYEGLKIRPELGRLLSPANDLTGGAFNNAAVISDRLWRSEFGGDPKIVGRTILLDKVSFVVIGVLAKNFFGVVPGEYTDIAITFAGFAILNPRQTLLSCRNCNFMEAMGRLRPGVTASQAEAALNAAWRSALRETMPENLPSRYRNQYFADRAHLDPAGNGLGSYTRGKFAKPLYLLLGMTGLILLIGCSNVANLLLARTQARRREITVRLSTGASRIRLMQQLLTESWLLALLGLMASVAIYEVYVRGLLWFLRRNGEEVFLDTRPDIRMVGLAAGLMLGSVLLFGLIPAGRAGRTTLRTTLAESAHTISRRSRFSIGMLAAQIATSVILVTGALLLARSLYGLRSVDAGFRRDHLLIASPDMGKAIPKTHDQERFLEKLMARIETLPGVRTVSTSTMLPLVRGLWMADYTAVGYTPAGKENTACYLNFVSPHYFESLGTPLSLGRAFTARDGLPGSPPVALVSESLAHHFWGNENPIGKQIHELEKKQRVTVIGVTRDAKYWSFRDGAPRTIYLPFPPPISDGMARIYPMEIWTAVRPEALIAVVRTVFEKENSQVAVEFQTFDDLLDRQLISERLLTILTVSFGSLGLLMAAVGIYGLAAYSVSRRLPEVGVRVALGATKPQIVKLFLNEHVGLIFSGILMGTIGASILTKFLRTWLFGISPTDLPSFAGGVALLGIVGTLAILVPTVRALKIDASRLLRSE